MFLFLNLWLLCVVVCLTDFFTLAKTQRSLRKLYFHAASYSLRSLRTWREKKNRNRIMSAVLLIFITPGTKFTKESG